MNINVLSYIEITVFINQYEKHLLRYLFYLYSEKNVQIKVI